MYFRDIVTQRCLNSTIYICAVAPHAGAWIETSKYKEQNKFIAGQEAEFTEEEKSYTDKNGNPQTFLVIKPVNPVKQSSFGKALKKEQSRYSGFAVSYAKDLVVAGRLQREELSDYAWVLFELMVSMDKTLEQ